MKKCNLCKNKEATKTGSHIVPSFLIKRINALDNCGKRESEVGYSYTGIGFDLYIGRNVGQDKLEELISSSQEKFIADNVNQDVRDYIFCPDCEMELGKIESEYSKTLSKFKKTDNIITHSVSADISLIFWISIIWRMAFTEDLEVTEVFKNHLRYLIKEYIVRVKNNKDTSHLIRNSGLYYKLFRCVDYSKTEATHLFLDLNKNMVKLVCDEYILILCYKSESKKCKVDFLGVEDYFGKVKFNTGMEEEEIYSFSKEEYGKIMENILSEIHLDYEKNIFEAFKNAHNKISFLPNYVDDFYPLFKEFRSLMNKEKIGEQYVKSTYVEALVQVIKEHPEVYGKVVFPQKNTVYTH